MGLSELVARVADIYLSDAFTAPPPGRLGPPPQPVMLSPEELASKVGLYREPTTDSVGRIFLRDGKLRASEDAAEGQSFELIPVGANRFVISGAPVAVEFIPAFSGRPQEIRVTGAGPKPMISQRVAPFAPSSAELRAFAGDYTSVEIEERYTLAPRGSGLVIQIPGRSDIILQPVFRDAFAGAIVGVVKFSREAAGAVTGFTINASGARGMSFERVKR